MKIKKIKQFLCIHDYKVLEKTYGPACLLRVYYECTKCGKVLCEKWITR